MESFNYYNTMRNGTIEEQLKMQEKEISGERKNIPDNSIITDSESLVANKQRSRLSGITENHISNQSPEKSVQQSSDLELSSIFGIFSSSPNNTANDEPQPIKPKKK